MRKPDFFIVGAPRCGTTSLYFYLKAHPDISMSTVKEPFFFATDFVYQPDPQRPWYPITDLATYLSLFAGAREEKRVGEATPWYLYSAAAPTNIKAFCPDARILITLRNPVDMMYSLHSRGLRLCYEDIADFAAALDAEHDRKQGRQLPRHPKEFFLYREACAYTAKVRRYLDLFGRDQVQVIIFDDLQSDTARVYRQTCAFLGVDPTFAPDFPIYLAHSELHSQAAERVFVRSPLGVRRLGRAVMPRPLREFIRRSIRRFNVRSAPRPPLPPQLRERLQKECAPDVEALSELLGRDLTSWCSERGGRYS